MSLISKDFRFNDRQETRKSHASLRWTLLAAVCASVFAIISNTSTEEQQNPIGIASELLPVPVLNEAEAPSTRKSFTLALPNQTPKKQTTHNKESIVKAQKEAIEIAYTPEPEPSKEWRDFTIKNGDSLARVFQRAKIKPQQLDELMKSGGDVKILKRIFPGDTIRMISDSKGTLQALHYEIDQKSYLLAERGQNSFISKVHEHEIETREAHANGVIDSSLFLAAQKSGISHNIIMELANIFGWDIDFVLDIREGDSFTVLYEELYHEGKKIADGKILAADFVNNGKTYRAVRYTNPKTNESEYYTPDGNSMRKAFLRTPINFARISSRFNLSRYHPVLHKFRSHKGVDYAAKRGTPIFAAGDGKVIFKGKKGGYGNVVILQHGSKYTTLYAHVKSYNRKLRVGSKVKQGQTIAYVGSSGLATGPHLHYEFRLNGVHRNPLTVKLPISNPVPKHYMADFDKTTAPIMAQLDLITRPQQVALTDN